MTFTAAEKAQDAFDSLVEGWRGRPGYLIFLIGVVLPVVALVTELASHMCGGVFFNPVPTLLHAVLVALVPAANLWLYLCLRQGRLGKVRLLAWSNGAAIGVALFYSIIFIPILPFGAVGIIFYGLGLLVLAPPLALVAAWSLRRYLTRNVVETPRGLWAGFACALGLLALVEIPSTVTRWGLQMAASEKPGTHVRGIHLLRALGDKNQMLRLCYAWPTHATDLTGFLLSMGQSVGTEKAREIYYQVRGVTFNSLPAPERDKRDWFEFARFDPEQGGASVSGRIPGLSLSASRIDASIDAQAAFAYQEWTLEFANQGTGPAEARAQIELPPEGVVSRLTLWVDGEEREAAFAARSQVRAAYERVVQARRDPVLVTAVGADRVLMQCFPVPAGGGRMKVRIGITSPLAFSSAGEAHFHAPRFAERNFGVSEEEGDKAGRADKAGDGKAGNASDGKAVHSLWLEANEPFPAQAGEWELGNSGDTHTLRGLRSDAWLSQGQSWVVGGSGGNHAAWTVDSTGRGKSFIKQWTETSMRAPLGQVTLMIDGSKGMRPYLAGICGAIRLAGRPVRVVLAGSDEVREFRGGAQEAGNWLERQPCVGGQDNVPGLMRAWDAASRDKQGVLLWITAGQAELLSRNALLRQNLERRPEETRFLALQVANGPNRLLEELDGLPITALRFSGTLQEELQSLLSASPVTRTVLVRKRQEQAPAFGEGKRTSDHLARIFAHGEINRLIAEGGASRDAAAAVASAYRLVTPVSGAVVLESADQYAAAGLEPGSPATVPGVPEPEMVWLALAAAGVLLARTRPWRFLKARKTAV